MSDDRPAVKTAANPNPVAEGGTVQLRVRIVTLDEIRTELDDLIELVALGAANTNSYRDGVLALVERYADQTAGDANEVEQLLAELHDVSEREASADRDVAQALAMLENERHKRLDAEKLADQQRAELQRIERRRRSARRVAFAVVGLPLLGAAVAAGLFFGGVL